MRVKVAHLVLVDGVVHEIEEGGTIPGLGPEISIFRIAMATIIALDGWTVGWLTHHGEHDTVARGLPRGRAVRRLRRMVARGGEVRLAP